MDRVDDKRLKVISESGTNCFKQSVPSEGESMARELLAFRQLLTRWRPNIHGFVGSQDFRAEIDDLLSKKHKV